ncbi:hypothetical protein AB0P15_37655 [Streptomyces sp. NPDC087917]|uniref:hypothetical protein n=1 Tax=Streptomyces sp. NPDC087917 TaxID=3155060 RepID=UPI003439A581
MSIAEQQQSPSQPRQPAPQPSGGDRVQTLLVALVVLLVLAATGYACVTHPALTDVVAAVAGVATVLAATFTVACTLRQR